MTLKSAIYRGKIRHRRFEPREHHFSYSVCYFLLDLEELEKVFAKPGWMSLEKPGVLSFRRKDYFGDSTRPLMDCVRDRVEEKIGSRPEGPIRLLTQIRYFGFSFNPVSFYYCFDQDGKTLHSILTEITNTPWNERHAYVLACKTDAEMSTHLHQRFDFKKDFHVSPFMGMNMNYRWIFSEPGEALSIQMENRDEGAADPMFDATLTLSREELNPKNVFSAFLARPFMTFTTVSLIYLHALILKLKRIPFHAHPEIKPNLKKVNP